MGLFSKKINYPELQEDHPAAKQLNSLQTPLEELAGQVSDPLEVVPAEDHAYVFIGKPPKKFGIAVLEEGSFQNFVAVAQNKGLDNPKILAIIDKIGDAYKENEDTNKFKTTVSGKEIVVTPCPNLETQVAQIIQSV